MNIALVLSGGTGTRLGADMPKQYIEVQGKPILLYCLETLCSSNEIDAVQIVAAKEWQDNIFSWLEASGMAEKCKGFSLPGKNRQLSILHGLADIRKYASEEALVLIHDGARPLLSAQLITQCFDAITDCDGAAAERYDGVLPVLPMKDTVYVSKNGKEITSLLNRSEVCAGQAPELFRLGAYYRANERLLPDQILQINGSTEPAVLGGLKVAVIPGDEGNFKITTQADLERFINLIEKG